MISYCLQSCQIGMKNDVCFGDFLHRSNFWGRMQCFHFFTTSTWTVEKEKKPHFLPEELQMGIYRLCLQEKKNPRKFNAISAHELFDLKVTVEVKWDFLISIQDDLDAQTLIIWKYYLILVKFRSRIHTKWDILQWFSTTIRSIFPSAIFDSFIHIKCNCSRKKLFLLLKVLLWILSSSNKLYFSGGIFGQDSNSWELDD